MLSVYQAELPAHGSRGFSGLFVKSCLWGRRRDVHTVLGWFEPGLQAPLAKAFYAFQACTLPSYVTAATSGVAVSRGISKFPTGPDREELVRIRFRGVFLFFFQAEDGIRYLYVTGVQTCALPI